MIERISIKGFKSIVDAEMELGRLNVLVGANGAGKSNLLEAIGLLGCAVSGRVDEAAFRFRGVRPGTAALYKTAFEGGKIPRLIRLEAQGGGGLYRVALDNPIDEPAPLWRFSNESIETPRGKVGGRGPAGTSLHDIHGGRIDGIAPEKTQGIIPLMRSLRPDRPAGGLLDALQDFAIYTPYTPILRGSIAESAPREPVGLNGGGLAGALRDLGRRDKAALEVVQREVLDLVEWSSQVQTRASEGDTGRALYFRDARMRAGRDVLAAADASEGALYVLFLMLLLYHPAAPGFLAIDNIDSALHPRLARVLVERAQRRLLDAGEGRQLIVTTHNPLVLDALRLADERVRLFVVSRESGSGFTVVRRIEHGPALLRSVARGRTLSQLWVEGALGGVPQLM